ncbi:erythromycin esterase family protein [Mesonia aestuariivivens]|uniref:Erythromycin esterase family protein n=1 Tax=Mesonia aestuariivivens TaxID=2796128 RepID=A0ABS6W3U5_9FLAO|nr:erythromycin esterase family protein [Mesonia aestuariivivens]MBW2962542.1 erythromycin esterase family protein [Mesonia aestuariivivens]
MKKILLLTIILFLNQILFSQIEENTYELNSLNNLLTEDVKKIISPNINEKQTVFLGESVHYSGSDFIAKTEFIKYLVSEHGFKDIIFESDFFALLFDHNKRNLYTMWSKSKQCEELFDFLEKNKVTIWGFDSRIPTAYSHKYFTIKLSEFLKTNDIKLDQEFSKHAKTIIKDEYEVINIISKEEIEYINDYLDKLLSNELIKKNQKWVQILESFKSSVKLYTVKDNNSDNNRIKIRDKQMAENLAFLVKKYPDKKFIIWLANGHMSKSNSEIMNGQTMGHQFRQLNPKTSYHIAFGSIELPPTRTKDETERASRKNKSILHYLPSIKKNYFVDSKKIISTNKELKNKKFDDLYIFNLTKRKTKLLSHFDALVFIANGEEVEY